MQTDQPQSNSVDERLRFVDRYKRAQKRNFTVLAGGLGVFLLIGLANGFRPEWNTKANYSVSKWETKPEEALLVKKRDTIIPLPQSTEKLLPSIEIKAEDLPEEDSQGKGDSPVIEEEVIASSFSPVKSSAPISKALEASIMVDTLATFPMDSLRKHILDFADKMPSFPGGASEMDRYIDWEMNYPRMAEEYLIEGMVYVQFTVAMDGVLSDVEVAKGIGYGCDEEAMRIVKSMPNWYPGEHEGQFVAVRYTLPVDFSLPH